MGYTKCVCEWPIDEKGTQTHTQQSYNTYFGLFLLCFYCHIAILMVSRIWQTALHQTRTIAQPD